MDSSPLGPSREVCMARQEAMTPAFTRTAGMAVARRAYGGGRGSWSATGRLIGSPRRFGLTERSRSEESMNSDEIFAVETVGSLVVFTLIAVWYWAPRLSRLAAVDALTALLLLHAFRGGGLTIIVPEVGVDPNLPRSFAVPAAYGDLI